MIFFADESYEILAMCASDHKVISYIEILESQIEEIT
jgi:hypothetical protein